MNINENKVINSLTILALSILAVLGIGHLLQSHLYRGYKAIISILVIGAFYILFKKLNQDNKSYFALTFTLVLENFNLYSEKLFGIGFDHYTHFLGGFTIAIIVDRYFNEKLTRVKRFILLLMAALGIGAIVEIGEWLAGTILPHFEIFGEDAFSNCILDMIFNGLGGITMSIIALIRKDNMNR